MYNIIEQHHPNHSASGNESVIMMMLNSTKSSPVFTTTSGGFKIDCAKECPCNVPVIPVPDQWLEVMVTGGFKVWHIIFIIIAFMVTIVVVYCCFHRCRIPRTKQEIEADLMRTNLTTKFRDYMQEFPNEPTTFLEALKKVQEIEEKSMFEQDDSGTKKRMNWLKLRGKDRQADKTTGPSDQTGDQTTGTEANESTPGGDPTQQSNASGNPEPTTVDPAELPAKKKEFILKPLPKKSSVGDGKTKQSASSSQKEPVHRKADLRSAKMPHVVSDKANTTEQSVKSEPAPEVEAPASKSHKTKSDKAERHAAKQKLEAESAGQSKIPGEGEQNDEATPGASATSNRPARARRKRDKPNLSRTKAAHIGSRGESIEAKTTNILSIPVTSHRGRQHHIQYEDEHKAQKAAQPEDTVPAKKEPRPARAHTSRSRMSKKESTVIQITTDLTPT